MFTPDEINSILKPWGDSLDKRPVPSEDDYAYEDSDRKRALEMATKWEGGYRPMNLDTIMSNVLCDFICHQSDVIEMLCHALSFANQRIDSQDNFYAKLVVDWLKEIARNNYQSLKDHNYFDDFYTRVRRQNYVDASLDIKEKAEKCLQEYFQKSLGEDG